MQMNKDSSQEISRSTPGKVPVSLSQGVMLIAVLLLFLCATVIAFTQSPRFNALQPPTFSEQLFYPWESNAAKRLPIVIGNLNDVFVLPDSQLVWAVGDGGMILHSDDGGITWVQQDYPRAESAKKAASARTDRIHHLSLFPMAVAAAPEPTVARFSKAPADEKQIQSQNTVEQYPSSSESQLDDESSTTDTGGSTQAPVAEPESKIPDDKLPDFKFVYFGDAKNGVVLDQYLIDAPSSTRNIGTADGGATWQFETASKSLQEKVRDLAFHSGTLLLERGKALNGREVNLRIPRKNPEVLLAVGDKGVIFRQVNNLAAWQELTKFTDSNLNALEVFGDKNWLVVGDDGLIARSDDDGETWYPLSRGTFSWSGAAPSTEADLLAEEKDTASYWRFPAPWYWLVCCLVIVFGISFFARQRLDPIPQEKSIADLLAPDRPLRPGDPDPLGYNSIACGLSRFMRNPSTEPPMTLAITGAWGSGKSSMMNLLYHDLKKFGFTPVWFNAWHHQKGEQLLASLYANIRSQAVPSLFSFSQFIPVGLMFRINLLFRRGVKHWLMTVILIGVFAASATYLLTHSESSALSVNKITEALATPGFSWETLLIALFGNVAPLMALLQGLRAFGLNPLSLMTAQNDRQAQGRVDPSARQQFAREFNEVAKSLSLGRMVIFIDDLDRCSKENVVDILEAINFLSVSGDCYIVLGMDETWVKICINEHFIAMSDRNPDFADQYLEKMINIKVPVPQLSDADSSKLLTLELPDMDDSDEAMAVRLWRGLKNGLHPYRYFLLMVCVVVLGIFFGFILDSLIRPEVKPVSPQQIIATWNNISIDKISMAGGNPDLTLRVQDNAVSTSLAATSSSWELSLNATKEDLAKGIVIGKLGDAKASASLVLKEQSSAQTTSATVGENNRRADELSSQSHEAQFRNGQRDNVYGDYWLPLLVGALFAFGVIMYSKKLPMRRPEDSADFKKALEIWKPWILLNRQTPRAIKRYLNRVRYMAMRYRTEPEPRSISLREALSQLFRKQHVADEATPVADDVFEANLVALSAIQAADTPWAANVFDVGSVQIQDVQELVKSKLGEQAMSSASANALVKRLLDAIEKHQKQFGDASISEGSEQEKFVKILADMQIK